MESPGSSVPKAARHELEDLWRRRLEQAFEGYQTARLEHRRLLAKEPGGAPQAPNSALDQSRRAESGALAEYLRVLRIFRGIAFEGKLPEETFDERIANYPGISAHDLGGG
jgi:hypothetical protein